MYVCAKPTNRFTLGITDDDSNNNSNTTNSSSRANEHVTFTTVNRRHVTGKRNNLKKKSGSPFSSLTL